MAKETNSIMAIDENMKDIRMNIRQWMQGLELLKLGGLIGFGLIIMGGLLLFEKYPLLQILTESNTGIKFGITDQSTFLYWIGFGGLGLFWILLCCYVSLLIKYKIKTMLTGFRGVSLQFPGENQTEEKIILVNRIYNYEEFY